MDTVLSETPVFSQLVKKFPTLYVATTSPYLESEESSPHSAIEFFKIRFNIILPFTLDLSSGLFESGFPHLYPVCS
jgi:hypothetical protein